MSDKSKNNIRLICDITVSALLVITGILLIISCVYIYNLGDRPFTVESISAAFDRISIPVFVTLGAVVVGMILQLIFPRDKQRIKATLDKKKTVLRLEDRLDTDLCDDATLALIAKEKKLRVIMSVICAILCVSALIPALIYSLNVNNYPLEDYNASVITACLWVLPCAFVACGLLIALSYIKNASLDRQMTHIRSAIAQGAKKASTQAEKEDKPEGKLTPRLILGVRIVILVLAVFFIIEGISNGGASDVLIKAINICTECIGLG